MSCCLGSSPFYFWKHLDIVRHIEFKNAFPQIRSRERKFEQRLVIKYDNDPGLYINCFCTFHLPLQSPLTPEPYIPLGHAHL